MKIPAAARLRSALPRATRFTLHVDVSLSSESNFYQGVTQNVSEGGVCVICDQPIPIGTRVDVSIRLPDSEEAAICAADVRWHRTLDANGRVQHGLRFLDVPDDLRAAMRTFSAKRPPTVHSAT